MFFKPSIILFLENISQNSGKENNIILKVVVFETKMVLQYCATSNTGLSSNWASMC